MTVPPDEFQKRIDDNLKRAISETAPGVSVHPRKPRVVKAVEPVDVKPLPAQPYYHPFKTEAEYLDALKDDTEKRGVVLDNEEIRKGQRPLSTVWWKWAAAGAGALVIAYLKGCGGNL